MNEDDDDDDEVYAVERLPLDVGDVVDVVRVDGGVELEARRQAIVSSRRRRSLSLDGTRRRRCRSVNVVLIVVIVQQMLRQETRLEVAHAAVDLPPYSVRLLHWQLRLQTSPHNADMQAMILFRH